GSPSALNLPGAMSAFLWVWFDDVIGGRYGRPILTQSSGCLAGGQFWLDIGRTDNAVSLLWANTLIDTSSATFQTGRWYHVGFTREGSPGNWTSKIYINGVLNKTKIGITTNPNGYGQLPTYIGGLATCAALSPFYGKIDDVHIYNRALS